MSKCDACDSLEISLSMSHNEVARLSSENFKLETENTIWVHLANQTYLALKALYEDMKLEHGLDDFSIERDSSSLGRAKIAIAKYKAIIK